MTKKLEDIFEVPRIIDGHLVLKEKSVHAVYEIRSKLNPITADSRDLIGSLKKFQGAVDSLRPGEKAQIILNCRRYDPSADIAKMNSRISEEAASGFRDYYPLALEKYLDHYCAVSMVPLLKFYVVFTYEQPQTPLTQTSPIRLDQKAAEVDRRARDFITAISDTHVSGSPLNQKELTDLIDESMNPSRLARLPFRALQEAPENPGLMPSRAELLLRSPVAFPEPKLGKRYDYIQVGSRLVRTMGLLRAPGDSAIAAIQDLCLSQVEFRLAFHIEGLSQERVKEIIQKKRASAAGAVTIGGGRNTQGSEEQALGYDSLLRKTERKEIRFCKWAGYLSVFGDDEEELQEKSSELASLFSDMVPDQGIYRQIEYWQSTLPLGIDFARNSLLADTSGVAGLYPFYEYRSSSPEGGILMGFSPANQPIFYDPWSKAVINGNVFVTGQAGSGKSFLISNILNRLGPQAHDLSIIDKAKSYKFTCLALGGDYIEWDLDGRHAVNVWDVMEYEPNLATEGQDFNDVDVQGAVCPEKIDQVLGLAEIFMAETGQSLTKIERSILMTSIQETYRRIRKSASHEGPRTGSKLLQSPIFSDLADTLRNSIHSDPDDSYTVVRRDLLQKLTPALTGPLAGLVNRKTTLNIQGRVRVFDISNLPERDEIQGVAMYILTTWLMSHWRRNKAKNIKQIAVLDEMYFFMLFSPGRRLLDNLARRSRHLGLCCFFATQQLDDVLLYPETPAILRNSDTKILFRQDKSIIDKLASLLSLTDQERSQLESLRQVRGSYSNAFFIYGGTRNILTVRPDPITRWLNTTEPTYDVPRRAKALEQTGGEPWAAIRLLLSQETLT
jgi:hypothetical protein